MRHASRLLAVCASLALLLVACAGSPGAASPAATAAANARDASAMDRRLQGAWRLVDYRPYVAPDPMFQALLASQVGVMIVRLDHGQLSADSPTFHVTRPYRVVTAAGPLFTVESPDVGGAVFTTSGTLSEDGRSISFQGDTEPWRGAGSLARVE